MTEEKKNNPLFDDGAQAITDKHLEALMRELEEAGIKAIGVVAGVFHAGECAASWCISDEVHDEKGETVPVEKVVHGIAVDIERATRLAPSPAATATEPAPAAAP